MLVHRLFKVIVFLLLFSVLGISNAYPKVTAKSWLVADNNGTIIEGVNTKDIRSIASITKLMTAMVILDADQSLTELIKYKKSKITRLEALQLTVAHSDNEAAKILCDNFYNGYQACIKAMNEKSEKLGMYNTKFTDSTGLSVFNVSTAEELIKLVSAASNYPVIVEASNMPKVVVKMSNNKNKTFHKEFNNTNPLVFTKNFIISKTGYISNSGGCIVMMVETLRGIRTVVLLGSKNTKTRIPEASLISSLY